MVLLIEYILTRRYWLNKEDMRNITHLLVF